ncbi:putative uncharacterized protein DDB_G0289263 isoform X1 [Drosophila takahashii]|uniref:putative uncharacterized protein DDB_G0289263 isoform X1 n=1 Tax=Drosophila takahashii TaxID=29030 RepID=UPI001CF8541B|nr:putative uncharacterized protein DDB_G0286901 isoform X1 [Drosophila takahashii]
MSRRSNFIEGNDNFREQNLRFVRNEFEDNVNQFFGGANPGGSGQQQKPPPRDSLIVQPTAGSNELDNRREFLRELGASRMLANALAQRTLSVPNFNLRQFQRQRFRLSVELGDSRQDVVDKEVLRAIGEMVENQVEVESRPRTPSPPRNIDWHNISPDNSPVGNDRSRPRNRQREGNFQERRDNSQGIARQREPINRNSGPINAPINRNRELNRNNPGVHSEEINRNNQNKNIPNRNANRQEFNRNNINDEFSREPNNRNTGPIIGPINRNRNNPDVNPEQFNRNANAQEFNRIGNPQEFNRNANPQEINRNLNSQEFNRNNRNDEFIRNNRSASRQDLNRNTRNVNSGEYDRNNRNLNSQELNRNNRNSDDFNRHENVLANRQEFNHPNRNVNPQFNRSDRSGNPQEFNRNAIQPEFNRNNRNVNDEFNRNNRNANDEFNRNNRNVNNDEFNRNNQHNRNVFPQGPNRNNRQGNQQFNQNTHDEYTNQNANIQVFNRDDNNGGQLPITRGNPSNFNNTRMNDNNRGSDIQNFIPGQRTNLDRNSLINQRSNIDENFQIPRDRFRSLDNRPQQQQQLHYTDQEYIRDMDANVGGNPGLQTGRNYQRIVNDNQITLCRTDWIEANENLLEDPHFINEREDAMMSNDHFRGQQHEHFRRPDVRERDDLSFIQNFRGNQPNLREPSNDDRNSYGRDRSNRNVDGNRRQFDQELDRRNLNDDFNQRNNSSRGVDIQHFSPREDDAFQGSNNQHHFSPNRYQPTIDRGSGSGDHYRGGPNPNRPKHNRPNVPNEERGPNPHRLSLDRNTKRNNIPGGPQQQRSSSRSNINTGVQSQPRSNSLTTQNRSTSRNPGGREPNRPNISASQERSATRNVNSGGPNQGRPNSNPARDGKPGIPSQNIKKSGVPPKNRGPNQNKPNLPATGSGQQPNKPKPAATKNNKAMANPRAGKKREAETTELGAKKGDPKRQRMDTNRSFIIGGIRLPYINTKRRVLPQPEEESYAVTFFEQTPIYNTNIYATDDGEIDQEKDEDEEEEDLSDTESLDSNRSNLQSGSRKRNNNKKKIRAQLRKEWTKIYRTNNYKDWHNWWRDYKWCGGEINKKLEKYGDRSLRHRFAQPGRKPINEKGISQVFKSAHMGLEKNTFNHYRNMRSIFLLMNEDFLGNLTTEQMEDVQDLIRGIPNHLWLYKIRAMVYLWERYHGTLKTQAPKNVFREGQMKTIAKEWKNPLFHWLAKQAFDELKAISEIAWPDFNKIYPGLKS